MARHVIWTLPALEDVDAAADYLVLESPRRAADLVREAFHASDGLAAFPMRGHVVQELAMGNIREMRVRSYRLLYRVDHEMVPILGFVHTARALARAWLGRPREG